ncbi:hypothetical protein CEXT_45981 [Caerostris extrusa]|uniref:Uncharacterized protein n=1 Tax=Caerostris extrusa TaxID=172846 RepID=A0AAV4T2P8_CAEEX|nr:hypothetical protein CEXT_45981 [Caerostris extrusa]
MISSSDISPFSLKRIPSFPNKSSGHLVACKNRAQTSHRKAGTIKPCIKRVFRKRARLLLWPIRGTPSPFKSTHISQTLNLTLLPKENSVDPSKSSAHLLAACKNRAQTSHGKLGLINCIKGVIRKRVCLLLWPIQGTHLKALISPRPL